jgi:hypothetical protein
MTDDAGGIDPFAAVVLAAARAASVRRYMESPEREAIRVFGRVLALAARKVGIDHTVFGYDFPELARRILVEAKKTAIPAGEYACVYRIWQTFSGQTAKAVASTPAPEPAPADHHDRSAPSPNAP